MPSPPARRPPPARNVTAALAWLVAAVAATLVGLTAVGAIGSGIVGTAQPQLSPAEVDARLAAAGTTGPAASATPAATVTVPEPTGATDVLASAGGSVVARCSTGGVEVLSATPAQGYRVHDEGGDDPGRVRFESDGRRVELRLACRDGRPVADVRVDDR